MSGMKVVLCLDSRAIGGIESHVANLAEGLVKQQLATEVWFCRRYQQSHPLEARLSSLGCRVRYLDQPGFSLKIELAQLSKQAAVVHSHGYKANLLMRLNCRRYGVPHFSGFHAGERCHGKLAAYQWLDRVSATFSQHNFAASPEIAASIAKKASYLPNFVSLPATPRLVSEQPKVVAFIGRLVEVKAPQRFLALAAQFPQLRFWIFGEGPLEAELRSQAPGNLQFMGLCNMQDYWAQIDLVCITSLQEGLPLSALESMAHGIPVFACKVGALSELICSGYNGHLFDGFQLAQWQTELSQWWTSSRQLRQGLAERAQNHIRARYSLEAVLPSVLKQYRAALA